MGSSLSIFLRLVPMTLARQNIASGDNHDPDPNLVDQMLKTSSNPDGSLSIDDYARYRVEREAAALPPGKYFAAVSFLRDFLATGEIGLVLPGVGRGSDDVLEVCVMETLLSLYA